MYKINKQLIVKTLNNKIVIFDGKESYLYNLNRTASFAFSKIKSGLNKEQIIKESLKVFLTSEKQLAKDFDELVSVLKSKGILVETKSRKRTTLLKK